MKGSERESKKVNKSRKEQILQSLVAILEKVLVGK